ncbi:MAG: hypothetical protein FIA99_19195 [Ruminiclostridium sp.]|nr:hypothetical protein [Ruminiclostridium sp.]
MSDNDRQLLALARKGNIEAFEKLTESHQKKVYNIILGRYSNRSEVSQLTQEVFVRMFKSVRQIQDDSLFVLSIYKTAKDVCGL